MGETQSMHLFLKCCSLPYNPRLGLFIHAGRLSTDNNTPTATTYSGHIPARLGLARLFRDVANPGKRRPSSRHMVPHRVAILLTEWAPADWRYRRPISWRAPLQAKPARPAIQTSVNYSPERMVRAISSPSPAPRNAAPAKPKQLSVGPKACAQLGTLWWHGGDVPRTTTRHREMTLCLLVPFDRAKRADLVSELQ